MNSALRIRRSPADRGSTLLEFAIIVPVLFLLLFTFLDLSLIVVGNTVGNNAARDGARVGIIDFDCADSYPGSPTARHPDRSGSPCPSPSPQYQAIDAAVRKRLVGLVRGSLTIEVRCLPPDTLSPLPCRQGLQFIQPGRDLIEVSVTWQHIGASPFVANMSHQARARMTLQGKPNT